MSNVAPFQSMDYDGDYRRADADAHAGLKVNPGPSYRSGGQQYDLDRRSFQSIDDRREPYIPAAYALVIGRNEDAKPPAQRFFQELFEAKRGFLFFRDVADEYVYLFHACPCPSFSVERRYD